MDGGVVQVLDAVAGSARVSPSKEKEPKEKESSLVATKRSSRSPVVQIKRLLPSSPEDVFDAWLDPDSLKEWLCPGSTTVPIAEIDARVGGRFRIVMRDEGVDHTHTGEYREITRPRRLVFSWASPATKGQTTLVTIELRGSGEQTELTLTHQQLPDKDSADKHRRGWESIMDKFARYINEARS
jgi:uncharacterized protein YndB with AHSA1/START domain